MMAKKSVALFLTLIIAAGLLAGCGTSNSGKTSSDSESKTTTASKNNTEESTSDTTTSNGDKKTLVVYYSATGNTKGVAETIAQVTDGDLFEIEPKEPYTNDDLDWTNDDSRVSREHDDESLRDVELVSTTVDNFNEYDEVLVGYPVWWGIAAWPVNQFIKNNDFTGKTVIPFCTSASSGLGDSGKLLEEMAGTGDWQEGMRFSSNASEEEIQDWVKSLNLN